MIVAAYRDNVYDLVLILHIVAVIVAFAPAVINPILTSQFKADGEGPLQRFAAHSAANTRRVHLPALVAIGLLGVLLVVLSDEVIEFSDTWVSLGLLVWLAICGIVAGVILPNERRLAAGDLAAEPRIARAGGLATLLILVMLYLMIFKPGA